MIVVSPLKALLMREQVEALKGRGLRAVCVGDALHEELVHDEIQEGRYQFLRRRNRWGGGGGGGGGREGLNWPPPPPQSWAICI